MWLTDLINLIDRGQEKDLGSIRKKSPLTTLKTAMIYDSHAQKSDGNN